MANSEMRRRAAPWLAVVFGGCLRLPDPIAEGTDAGGTGTSTASETTGRGSETGEPSTTGVGETGTTVAGDPTGSSGESSATSDDGTTIAESGGTAASEGTETGTTHGDEGSGSTGAETTGESGGTTDPTTTGGTTEGSVCGAEQRCVAPVPDGWDGYAVVGDAALVADCPPGYPAQSVVHDDLQWLPAVCGCECVDPEADCGPLRLSILSSNCLSVQGSDTIDTPDVCTASDLTAASRVRARFVPGAGSCTAVPDDELPEPGWLGASRLCGGGTGGVACEGGGVCIAEGPPDFASGVCVFRDGEFGCPIDFPSGSLHHRDFDDQRGCSECTCGALEDVACTSRVSFQSSCGILTIPTVDTGECVDPGDADFVDYDPPEVSGTCPAEGGDPEGQVLPVLPVTVCCAG